MPRIVRRRRTTTNDDMRRTGSRGVEKSDHFSRLRREKECSGEVKLDGSGVPVVLIDSPKQPSG